MPNPDNIKKHKFKKGKSGNPKGRPPIVSDIKTYIREKLAESPTKDADHTKLDAITAKLLNMAFSGNLKAMEICMSYGYGKPSQQIDITADIVTHKQIIFTPIEKQKDNSNGSIPKESKLKRNNNNK